jgi:hypothetical protein
MDIKRITAAAAAGVASTAAMTAWMLAGQLVSRHGEQPPKRIVRGIAGRAGAQAPSLAPSTLITAAVAHAGFGAGAGALYGATVGRSTARRGAAFGMGVWAISYAGWIPALDLLPPPHKDIRGRAWTILTAHGVYGGCLGTLLARYDRIRDDPDEPVSATGPALDRAIAGHGG